MKRFLLFIFIAFTGLQLYSQPVAVPFRTGNKFGLSDEKGKLILAPRFDILEPEKDNETLYFKGYNFRDSGILSSVVFKNKIIISDKDYDDYYYNNGLFLAIKYLLDKKRYKPMADQLEKKYHLYDAAGKKVFEEDFRAIGIIDDLDPKGKSIDEVLMYTLNQQRRYSMLVYNKQLKKTTKTIFENVLDFNQVNPEEYNLMNQGVPALTYIYKTPLDGSRKITIALQNNQFKVTSDEAVTPDKKNGRESYGFDDVNVAVPEMEPERPAAPAEGIVLTVRKIEKKRDFYYLPKQIEELKITSVTRDKYSGYNIMAKNGKQGLFNAHQNKFIIPIQYDEIMPGEFPTMGGGYILRNGNKYGLLIFDLKDDMTIEPVFDKIPLLVDLNYFRERSPLIKLYDEKGKLFCYANQTGKLYYSAK